MGQTAQVRTHIVQTTLTRAVRTVAMVTVATPIVQITQALAVVMKVMAHIAVLTVRSIPIAAQLTDQTVVIRILTARRIQLLVVVMVLAVPVAIIIGNGYVIACSYDRELPIETIQTKEGLRNCFLERAVRFNAEIKSGGAGWNRTIYQVVMSRLL